MSAVISKDGTRIGYEKSGQGAGTGVLLIDGALGYRENVGGRPLAAELAKTFTVITYDRRGRGESTDTPPYAVEREIEDIEALINELGGKAYVYGLSSGGVLALRAAAKLGADKIAKLVLNQPPFNTSETDAKQEFAEYKEEIAELIKAGEYKEAVTFFLKDILQPDQLAMWQTAPEWKLMEEIAPTLNYDNAVLGDGTVPSEASAISVPTLILDGSMSQEFQRQAADDLAKAMPQAVRKTLDTKSLTFAPEELSPVLSEFFGA